MRPRDTDQLRYEPKPEYALMVLRSRFNTHGIGPDWFAQNDIERPSLNGRLVETYWKDEP